VKCSGRRSTVEVPTLASLDRSLGTGGRPHQLPITACLAAVPLLSAHCLEAGLAVVVLLSAHCLEAGLAVVVLLTAWKQVLQSFRWYLLTAWKQVLQSSYCSLLGSRSCNGPSVEHWGTATPAAQRRSNTKCKGLRKGCRCLVNKIVFDGDAIYAHAELMYSVVLCSRSFQQFPECRRTTEVPPRNTTPTRH
jgi:hypothetical protein